MVNRTENLLSQRGDVPLHDWTQGGRPQPGFFTRITKLNIDMIGRALAFTSIGLGLMEVIMPKRVQKIAGVRKGKYDWLIRAAGLRELMSAMLIYASPTPKTGIWSRVAGDAMDLGLLGAAFTTPRVKKNNLIPTTAVIAGITALDSLTAVRVNRKMAEEQRVSKLIQSDLDGRAPDGSFRVFRSITIGRSPEELYRYWRNFANLPQFMYHLQEVQVLDDRRSHWVTRGPVGSQVSWDAEITDDRPNDLIAWQSMPGSQAPNSGTVRFIPAPANLGTVVRVEIEYRPPAGALGRIVAKLFGQAPGQQVSGDLERLKQVMETGEVIRSDGSPAGQGQAMQRPARPMTESEIDNKMTSNKMQRGKAPSRRGKGERGQRTETGQFERPVEERSNI